jgi:hypothetical protein
MMRASRRSLAPISTLAAALAFCIPCLAETPTPTITTLILSSTSVTAGTTVTLTAHVTASGAAVHPGTVTFCNASASHCEDAAVLGTAQLTPNGTAKLYLRLAPNTYSIRAIFSGTLHSVTPRAASSSAVLTLTVHGIAATLTSPPTATKTGSLYHVATTVVTSGVMPPTGTVSFHDTINGGTPIVLGSTSITGAAAQPKFGLPIPSNTAIQLATFVTGDFNNDGIPDIAGTNAFNPDMGFTPTVEILLGNGDGTFTPTSIVLVADFPFIVAAGDFNNDGNIDLAIGGDFGGVLLGHGDGTFSDPIFTEAGSTIFGYTPATVADIDGDGNLDLIAKTDSRGLGVIFGNGDGTFSGRSWSGSVGTTTVVADFNNDRILDLVTDLGLSYAQTELAKPDGTFTLKEAFPILPSPKNLINMAVGDFNNDGFPDIATSRADNTVVIELGKGDGTFTAMPPVTAGQTIVVADFNADGNLDVGILSDIFTILPGKGDGTFGAPLNFTAANGLSGPLDIADFNTDGLPDLFVTTPNSSLPVADSSFVMLGGLAWPASIGNIALPPATVHNIVGSYSGSPAYTASTSPSSAIITLPDVTSKLHIASSGFIYSRVTHTFNGTVTVTNISSSAIAGPLQVEFTNLSPGVTLANPTANVGPGFITIPAGLATGQSASIAVHFANPSNSVITYVPVAYTGAF